MDKLHQENQTLTAFGKAGLKRLFDQEHTNDERAEIAIKAIEIVSLESVRVTHELYRNRAKWLFGTVGLITLGNIVILISIYLR